MNVKDYMAPNVIQLFPTRTNPQIHSQLYLALLHDLSEIVYTPVANVVQDKAIANTKFSNEAINIVKALI